MFVTSKAERFDEVDEELDYAYRGWKYAVVAADAEFIVRTYDDEPGVLTVIAPLSAQDSPLAHNLVRYLLDSMHGHSVLFFDPRRGAYRRVDPTTLDFDIE